MTANVVLAAIGLATVLPWPVFGVWVLIADSRDRAVSRPRSAQDGVAGTRSDAEGAQGGSGASQGVGL